MQFKRQGFCILFTGHCLQQYFSWHSVLIAVMLLFVSVIAQPNLAQVCCFIQNTLMPLQTGQKAPDFTLSNTSKQPVSLAGLSGQNVVLLFFPLAFSSVCTAELCAVRDNMDQYNRVAATVLGISVDSVFALERFKKEQQLNFDLLSDFNKEASKAYDVLYDDFYGMKGVSKRAAFVVDEKGIIRYAEVLEDAGQQPDLKKIVQTLEQLLLTV